jgi:hypothetical protein
LLAIEQALKVSELFEVLIRSFSIFQLGPGAFVPAVTGALVLVYVHFPCCTGVFAPKGQGGFTRYIPNGNPEQLKYREYPDPYQYWQQVILYKSLTGFEMSRRWNNGRS